MNSIPLYGENVRRSSYKPSPMELRMSNLSNASSWEKKYEVVTQMLACGNARLVSSLTGVATTTISAWKKQPWWSELEAEIRREKSLALNSKLSRIIERSLELVEDRLENGNTKMTKDGTLVRVPVELKDVSKVSSDLLARQAVLEKTMTEAPAESSSIQDTLEALKKEFTRWASASMKNNATTIDFKEKEDAVHVEWSPGLQERGGSVYEQTSSEEETG